MGSGSVLLSQEAQLSPSWEPGEAGHRCPKGHTTQKGRLLGAHSTQYCLPQKLIGTRQVTGRRGHTWTSRGTGVLLGPTQGEGSFSQDLAVDSDRRGTGVGGAIPYGVPELKSQGGSGL